MALALVALGTETGEGLRLLVLLFGGEALVSKVFPSGSRREEIANP